MNTWAEPAGSETTAAVADQMHDRLVRRVADCDPVRLARAVLAVAVLHDVDDRGRCRVCAECRPRRWPWWHRTRGYLCPTRRVMICELYADTGQRASR